MKIRVFEVPKTQTSPRRERRGSAPHRQLNDRRKSSGLRGLGQNLRGICRRQKRRGARGFFDRDGGRRSGGSPRRVVVDESCPRSGENGRTFLFYDRGGKNFLGAAEGGEIRARGDRRCSLSNADDFDGITWHLVVPEVPQSCESIGEDRVCPQGTSHRPLASTSRLRLTQMKQLEHTAAAEDMRAAWEFFGWIRADSELAVA